MIYLIQADRRALEQAIAEAGATLTWKERPVVKAIAVPPPDVKGVPAQDDMPQRGTGDESVRTATPQVNQTQYIIWMTTLKSSTVSP